MSVPSNLCVKESWSECDLFSVCKNGTLVSEFVRQAKRLQSKKNEFKEKNYVRSKSAHRRSTSEWKSLRSWAMRSMSVLDVWFN